VVRSTILLLCGGAQLGLATAAAAQTIFTTEDFRSDRERWTDPAYYRHNTARQLTDMQVENRFGAEGSRADEYTIASPYPFRTSSEHFQAWRQRAAGGTKHTLATLPDWDGQWRGGGSWLDGRDIQASTIAAALTPQYREYYVQQVKAEAEGRHWWAASFCLPDGFIRGVQRAQQFIVRPGQVVIVSDMLVANQIRWIFSDGRDHLPERERFPQWQGESIGFWDGTALVVHTNQIRQWNATHSMFEWSDQMTAVERYERKGDVIEAEMTLYDPGAFLHPLHVRLRYSRSPAATRPVYSTCTDTNGPSSNVFVRGDGVLDERVPGDPGYWDPTDPRPWAAHYAIGERRRGESAGPQR
jgi:hypothetical protein